MKLLYTSDFRAYVDRGLLIQYGMVQKEVQSPLSTQYITTRFIYIEKGRSLLMQELHSFIIFDHTCLLC